MTALRAKIQDFSRERLMLLLSVYIICQPLLDILTAQGVYAGHAVTAGVVVRALFMALGFLYAVLISEFPGKRLPMIYAGALVGYLALFMLHMLAVGGLSLCFSNLSDVVKTFFTPFVLIFLYCIYKEYGFSVTTQSVGVAGAIYCSVILVAWLTDTSNTSYADFGSGYNGWFYAANEIGCIIALSAPFTIYHCFKMASGITKKTWWKGLVILWCLIAVIFSASFIGTRVAFIFILAYPLVGMVWLLFRLWKGRTVAALCQLGIMLALAAVVLGLYQHSALKAYKETVSDPLSDYTSQEMIDWWPEELQEPIRQTWLAALVDSSPTVQKLDKLLSRRLYAAAPTVEVYLEGGLDAKLLGIGYANTDAYSREIHPMIEMDPPAILVRHGIVGFLLYCVPYFAFIVYAVIKFFTHPLRRLSSLSYCTLLYCTLAGFAIAAVAGHALVSPAVSTFVLATGMGLWICTQEQDRQPTAQKAS